jgi:uncharacterized protein YukJ
MPLPGYGLLIGRITASRLPRRAGSHWLLWVQPGNASHPPYRVAVNLKSPIKSQAPALQYQIVNFSDGDALVKRLRKLGMTPNFLEADSNPSNPRLDFVRGDVVNLNKFVDVSGAADPLLDKFKGALAKATEENQKASAMIAVFGTGYPIDQKTDGSVPTGFTGIENIHMNQGAINLVSGAPYYRENGANQDGGVIFLFSKGAQGFFVKFPSQATDTDENGNPTVTGIDKIDKTPRSVRKVIMPPFPKKRAMAARRTDRTTVSSGGSRRGSAEANAPPADPNSLGYIFADVTPEDASGQYIPDVDAETYKTPFVMQQSLGHTRGPVPTPRVYPLLDLASIAGPNPPGYSASSGSKSIAFDIIGDSGAPSQDSLSRELTVTGLMAQNAQASPPAFLFHVGDVVYFYGEKDYYYSQFYEPFRAYPAPIFAIPGNHDGVTYEPSMISLDAFQKAFCASEPGRWLGSGAILRSAMTQPGVYFTLNAPLVSIIGLYSNCGESLGWLDEQQLMYLYQELVRLKKLRSGGLPAVILAIHHVPRWFPGQKQKDPNSTAIDATCKKAGFWPDAVISGHAHLYQRAVRQDVGKDVPYVITGAGGYAINPQQEVAKQYMATLTSGGGRLGRVILESGYVRASVTSPSGADPTLRFEYRSIKPMGNAPDDVCTVNLRTGKLV